MNRLLHNQDQVHRTVSYVWACLHGSGGPQGGEVIRLSIYLSFQFDHVYMMGGVTRHMLPHLPGVPHLHVKRPKHMKLFYELGVLIV